MRRFLALAIVTSAGCGAIIEPGHRGLLFDPRHGGLQHEVLAPGYHRVGMWGRIDDFDVTYSMREETMRAVSSDGALVEVRAMVRYRPIISELYLLDTEVGPSYAEEIVGPELARATRIVVGQHTVDELTARHVQIEEEVEATLRKRIAGLHIEATAVTLGDAHALASSEAVRCGCADATLSRRLELRAVHRGIVVEDHTPSGRD